MVKRREKQTGEGKEKKNEYTYYFLETWEKHSTSPRDKLVTIGNKKPAFLGRDCNSIVERRKKPSYLSGRENNRRKKPFSINLFSS